jgi:hypothetical protein
MQLVTRSQHGATDDATTVDMNICGLIGGGFDPQQAGGIGNESCMQVGHARMSHVDLRTRVGSDTERRLTYCRGGLSENMK